jgi:phospholipid/cholesterol/gamma-HCH transport system substrate-binding protein
MEKSFYQKLKLGIFVLAGIILFVVASIMIGQKQNLFGNSSTIHAVFRNTSGLKEGNNVRFSGLNAGKVIKIHMIKDTVILLSMSIHNDILVHVKKDSKAAITSDGLVGNRIVNIMPGGELESVEAGDTIQSFSRVSTDEILNTLSETNENAALLTVELLKIAKDITAGEGLIGALVQDPKITKNVKATLANIGKSANDAAIAVASLNGFINSFDKQDNLAGAIRDTALANQLKRTIQNIEQSSSEISLVVAQLNQTIKNVDQAVVNARDGKGSINYLSNDPELVKKIDNTMSNIDHTVIEIKQSSQLLNQNLEALKHTWPINNYFKKLEKKSGKK